MGNCVYEVFLVIFVILVVCCDFMWDFLVWNVKVGVCYKMDFCSRVICLLVGDDVYVVECGFVD